MKNIFLFLFCFSLHSLIAQITIDQDDFANAGDTVRMSEAVWNPLLNFSATDTNYIWDFSSLQWQSQYVDQFLNPLNTGVTYAFTFSNTSINPYRSNIAKTADNTLTTIPVLSSVFTDGINFFYKTSSLYRQRGLGMKVSGFSTPVPMTNPDTLYRFPMNYGNQDSAYSDYRVFVPQLGGYVHKQHRVNKVDGWGTLITPFGTFDALRVRTEIRGSDSLYIDTLNSGFKVNNEIQREYKWFGKNQFEPLLQINTQAGVFGQFPGFEFVTRIVYRDSVRFLPTDIFDMAKDEVQFSVFPNPSNGSFFVSVLADLTSAAIKLTDISGRLIMQREMNMPTEQVNAEALAKGIYILTLQSNHGTASKKLVVE
jgi:hypothetical protein